MAGEKGIEGFYRRVGLALLQVVDGALPADGKVPGQGGCVAQQQEGEGAHEGGEGEAEGHPAASSSGRGASVAWVSDTYSGARSQPM